MKRVLMIAEKFPPFNASGSARPFYFAKYLPELGFEPLVVACRPQRGEASDPARLLELPAGVRVWRSPRVLYPLVEQARSLRKKARALAASRAGVAGQGAGAAGRGPASCLKASAAAQLVDRVEELNWWLHWELDWGTLASLVGAIGAGRHAPDLIWATGPPFRGLAVAARLASWLKKPLVLDLRDPWTYGSLWSPQTSGIAQSERQQAERVLAQADRVVFTSPLTQQSMQERFPALAPSKLLTITNGFDDVAVAPLRGWPEDKCVFRYVGTLNARRQPDGLIRAFDLAGREPGFREQAVLELIGSAGGHEPKAALAPGAQVIFRGPVSHAKSQRYMFGSDFNLLLQTISEGQDVVSGKAFEYLHAGKPILAVVDPAGGDAWLMRHTGAGRIAHYDDGAAIAEQLVACWRAWRAGERGIPGSARRGGRMSQSPAQPLVVAPARPELATRIWAPLTLLCCALGFWLRWVNAHSDLGSPSVDENDVIQQAVAFMGGEWRYYLPEYGALPMYLLAALYRLVAWLRGLSVLDYAGRVFFDAQEQYLLGRLFCAACYVPLAVCSYRYLAPRFGRAAATISACLLSLPLLDQLTKSTVRIDVPQGSFQLGAMLLLALAVETGRWRHWLGAGLCAGLGMACKPLPGLLVAPCFVAASWYAADVPAGGAAGPGKALLVRSVRSLARPALWAAGALALAVAVLANPSAADVKEFIRGQSNATSYYSGPNAPGAHLTAFEALRGLRLPLLISAALSTVAMVFLPDRRAKLIALFPLVYASAFWGRPVRAYYMVAPAMALCVVIGICLGLLIERRRPSGAPHVQRAVVPVRGNLPARWSVVLAPGLALGFLALVTWVPVHDLYLEKQLISNVTLAREWIHANVPAGTKVFQYGTFAAGPRLVAASAKQAAEWGDFFDYGREKYDFYERAFRHAYKQYRALGRPYYDIESYRAAAEPANRVKPWLARSLARRAARAGQEYIILAGYRGDDYRQLGYTWIDEVESLQQFGKTVIFRVPLATLAPATPASATPAPAAPAP
jgi:glycosyltransferase involved in cell wall biosynthesis